MSLLFAGEYTTRARTAPAGFTSEARKGESRRTLSEERERTDFSIRIETYV